MRKFLSIGFLLTVLCGCDGARPPKEDENTVWEIIDSNHQSYFTHEYLYFGQGRVSFKDSADGREVILFNPIIREVPYKIRSGNLPFPPELMRELLAPPAPPMPDKST